MTFPHIRGFFDPQTWTVSYLVFDPVTKDALVIDPVLDYDSLRSQTSTEAVAPLIELVEQEALQVRAILETHAHADHLSAAQYLAQRYRVPVAIGAGITAVQRAFVKILHLPDNVATDGSQFDLLLESDVVYEFGSLRVKALSTPGHTPACQSFLIGDAVFTGDALFLEDYGTGRTDFPEGSARELYRSVTEVLVGHDYQPGGRDLRFESTIKRQKAKNIQLNAATGEAEFVAFRDSRDRSLAPPRLIFQSIQVNVFGGKLPRAEENGVRYLKIPLNLKAPTDEAGSPRGPLEEAKT
jgi:glyoxylase-like metal-dependent hydrolase (beta-lactamase superfamily II)